MLELHIGTKTTGLLFHQASKDFYGLLFSVFHDISEKRQDNEKDEAIDCEVAWKEAYYLLEEAKEEIEMLIKEKNTPWMDNLLRSLVDKLETACWTAKWFTKEEAEEEEKEEEPIVEEPVDITPKTKGMPIKK